MTEVSRQLESLAAGAAEIIPLPELKSKLAGSLKDGRPLKVKFGVDPTAPDLHLGHAVPLRKLRAFQELGHTVILLIGDYTALIGDPSERKETRPMLSAEEIEANAVTYTEQAFRILDREKTVLDRNSRWFKELGFDDVLGLTAKVTVARLIERDDFANRLRDGFPIGLHELMYPLMQAYDSVMLEADVEVGGTDQKFNLLAGRDLQREYGQEPQVVMTVPILEGTDGVRKMSKSYGNHIGLTDPPEEMFGKVMSIPDALIVKFFRLCTPVAESDVRDVESGLEQGELHPGETKRRLAREIVAVYHDMDSAVAAEAHFDAMFKGARVTDEGKLTDEVAKAAAKVPLELLGLARDGGKVWLVTLVKEGGPASSNSEARRLIEQGAVRLDGEQIKDPDAEVHVAPGTVLEVGKRFIAILE